MKVYSYKFQFFFVIRYLISIANVCNFFTMPFSCSIKVCNSEESCAKYRLPKDQLEHQKWCNVIPFPKGNKRNTFRICRLHWPKDTPMVAVQGGATRLNQSSLPAYSTFRHHLCQRLNLLQENPNRSMLIRRFLIKMIKCFHLNLFFLKRTCIRDIPIFST